MKIKKNGLSKVRVNMCNSFLLWLMFSENLDLEFNLKLRKNKSWQKQ